MAYRQDILMKFHSVEEVLMARYILTLAVLLINISTAQASSSGPCEIAKEHFVTISIDLLKEGKAPSSEDVDSLKQELSWLEENREASASCSSIEREQMKMFLADIR